MSNLDLMLSNYDVAVLCRYKNKLMLVPCDDSESGYYPNFDLGTPFDVDYYFFFPKFVDYDGTEYGIDGIMFIKTDDGIQIHCAEFGCDGFQIITDKR